MILTEAEIAACNDYDVLAMDFWHPTPATTPDLRRRVRLMAEKMARLRPREHQEYRPAPAPPPKPDPTPENAPPPPPKPPPKPKPKPPATGADLSLFKSLFKS